MQQKGEKKMAFLQRQKSNVPVKAFSVRLPVDTHEDVIQFCLEKRFTLGAGITYLIENALATEKEKQHTDYDDKSEPQEKE
jgi:hypothetical protein